VKGTQYSLQTLTSHTPKQVTIMIFVVYCFYILVAIVPVRSLKFRVTASLSGESGYKRNDVIDWPDEDFHAFVQNSVPLPEKTEKEAFYTTFPTTDAFVVRNVKSIDYFDPEDECYDPFAKFLVENSKNNSREYLQNVLRYYHIHTQSFEASEGCLPFVGKRNKVDHGYWNAMSANMTTLTPAHSDRSSNFVFCTAGTKYVFLWSPDDHQNLYMDKFFHSPASGSERTIRFRLEYVDLHQFPKFAKATRYVVKLGPNDVLHMPLKWIHHVFTEPGSFCLNMWFQEDVFNTTYEPVKSEDVSMVMQLSIAEQKNEKDTTFDRWHWTEDTIGLRLALANNNMVKIENAFKNPERFNLHGNGIPWKREVGTNENGFEWYNRDICEDCSKAFAKEMTELYGFFSSLLQLPQGTINARGTRYRKGQYLESHNDATMERVLSIVYHVTPPDKWNSTCGGELEWHGGSMYQTEPPSYNTLYLFLPRDRFSSHRIKPVHCGERYAYAGWLLSNETTPNYLSLLHSHEFKLKTPPGQVWTVEDKGTPVQNTAQSEVAYDGSEEEELEEEFVAEL